MYTYTAGGDRSSTLVCRRGRKTAVIRRLFKRLRDPATREKIAAEVSKRPATNGKICISAPVRRTNILLSVQIRKTETADRKIARRGGEDARQRSDQTRSMDLIAEDESRIGTDLFFDVGREREERTREAMDFIRLR